MTGIVVDEGQAWVFTSANNDQLFATLEARGEPTGATTDRVTVVAKISGGTGRFAGATGSFTAVFDATRDESMKKGTFAGTFEGHLDLNR